MAIKTIRNKRINSIQVNSSTEHWFDLKLGVKFGNKMWKAIKPTMNQQWKMQLTKQKNHRLKINLGNEITVVVNHKKYPIEYKSDISDDIDNGNCNKSANDLEMSLFISGKKLSMKRMILESEKNEMAMTTENLNNKWMLQVFVLEQGEK